MPIPRNPLISTFCLKIYHQHHTNISSIDSLHHRLRRSGRPRSKIQDPHYPPHPHYPPYPRSPHTHLHPHLHPHPHQHPHPVHRNPTPTPNHPTTLSSHLLPSQCTKKKIQKGTTRTRSRMTSPTPPSPPRPYSKTSASFTFHSPARIVNATSRSYHGQRWVPGSSTGNDRISSKTRIG
ncbi:hypothetical protein FA15DRAFT_121687 [Coprinopsis marcescibilis]|uniref:Uncharacterized protein n=1 Tax=Coprinopsis marcescibilis TaxID=230819 RepID=A0A5C3KK46_COPMA|nr:hypothetical protein FA15DRAFT_121687 [Coprinopsis marcescibilis]